jgi:hypothetical protein
MNSSFERFHQSEENSPASDSSGKKRYQPRPWETEGASGSKSDEKKHVSIELAPIYHEQQDHHIEISQEQEINEEVSTSQYTPEHRGEVHQMLDRLIAQHENDPKHSLKIKKAFLKFMENKIRGENRNRKTKRLLELSHEADEYFYERHGSINERIYHEVVKGAFRCYNRRRLPEEMYGWRLTLWRRVTSCFDRPHPQEQGHEHQRTQGEQTSE